METLKLSELIEQEICDLRFHYIPENEHGLQSFHSYIKLTDGKIIDIPNSDDEGYRQLTQENLEYLQRRFDSGDIVNDSAKKYFVGQKITDFFFCYYNDEIDFDRKGYIQLSNEYYLTENNFGPVGLTDINLIILDENGFLNRNKGLKIDARSFLQTKKNIF